MARASWQGALLVAFVWIVLLLWRRSTPSARAWLWLLATTKFLLVMLLVVEVPVLAPVDVATLGVGGAESSITYSYGAVRGTAVDLMPALFWLWLFGVFVVVMKAASDHARLKRLVSQAAPAEGRIADIWREVSGGAKARVRVHSDAPVPLVFGLMRPCVLLPQLLVAQMSDDELRMVLAHEAAHVRRRDAFASLYMFVCYSLFYFHPAVWLARREWQLDREAACDRTAIEVSGASAHSYAAMLLKVSAGADRAPVLALSAVPTYRTLHRRINEMKQPKNNLRSGRAVWALLALLVSAGAVPVALTQRKPHFGAGVFETRWPDVKVSQALKDTQVREDAVATSSTVAVEQAATAVDVGPAGLAQVAAPTSSRSTGVAAVSTVQIEPTRGVATVQIEPTRGVATVGAAGQATTRPTGSAPSVTTTVRPSGQSGGVATAGPIGGRTVPVTGGPAGVASVVGAGPRGGVTSVAPQTGGLGGTVTTDAEIAIPTMGSAPTSATIVLRDKKAAGGKGLDTVVSIDLDDVAVKDFFKFLSSLTKVKIVVKGLRSGMRLNAQIENTTLGEVMGTLAKVYGLEWRLEGDGSITVQPFRK